MSRPVRGRRLGRGGESSNSLRPTPPRRPAVRRKREPVPRDPGRLPTAPRGGFHRRALRRAWRQFQEGSLSHWITTLIIALSLTIYGSLALILGNAEATLDAWRGESRITIFLKKEADAEVATRLQEELASRNGVVGLRVVTPADAIGRLREMLGSEGGLLDGLEANPLPYSLEMQLDGVDHAATALALADDMGMRAEVEAVSYDRQWMERLAAVLGTLRYTGMALSALLLVAVALIVSNTIKLTIIARREEVEVMRFMGATDAFIKTPFVYEGVIQGGLGGILAVGLVEMFHLGGVRLLEELGDSFGFTMQLQALPWEQAAFILVLALLLGVVGALISVSRFLQV